MSSPLRGIVFSPAMLVIVNARVEVPPSRERREAAVSPAGLPRRHLRPQRQALHPRSGIAQPAPSSTSTRKSSRSCISAITSGSGKRRCVTRRRRTTRIWRRRWTNWKTWWERRRSPRTPHHAAARPRPHLHGAQGIQRQNCRPSRSSRLRPRLRRPREEFSAIDLNTDPDVSGPGLAPPPLIDTAHLPAPSTSERKTPPTISPQIVDELQLEETVAAAAAPEPADPEISPPPAEKVEPEIAPVAIAPEIAPEIAPAAPEELPAAYCRRLRNQQPHRPKFCQRRNCRSLRRLCRANPFRRPADMAFRKSSWRLSHEPRNRRRYSPLSWEPPELPPEQAAPAVEPSWYRKLRRRLSRAAGAAG